MSAPISRNRKQIEEILRSNIFPGQQEGPLERVVGWFIGPRPQVGAYMALEPLTHSLMSPNLRTRLEEAKSVYVELFPHRSRIYGMIAKGLSVVTRKK